MPDTDLRYCGYKILGKNVGECALAWWQNDGVVVKSATSQRVIKFSKQSGFTTLDARGSPMHFISFVVFNHCLQQSLACLDF